MSLLRRLLFIMLPLCSAVGCSYLGYQKFKPQEVRDYDAMLHDPLQPLQEESWLWVRGRITGDLDGDRNDEEVVLATVQGGDMKSPRPFTRAILLVCRRRDKGDLQLVLRRHVYEAGRTISEAALPRYLHVSMPSVEMRSVAAKIVEGDGFNRPLLLVSCSGPLGDDRVGAWHAGYRLDSRPDKPATLRCVFSCLAIQEDASVHVEDLDKDGRNELLVHHRPLSRELLAGVPDTPAPDWPSVYTLGDDDTYVQGDKEFPKAYDDVLLSWYQAYALAMHSGATAEGLSTPAYYLGLLHRFRGELGAARIFLQLAREHSESATLTSLAEEALRSCEAATVAQPPTPVPNQ